jgi:hypothetical protein
MMPAKAPQYPGKREHFHCFLQCPSSSLASMLLPCIGDAMLHYLRSLSHQPPERASQSLSIIPPPANREGSSLQCLSKAAYK